MGIWKVIYNKFVRWFLNEAKDEEYIRWCTEHGYIEDLQVNNRIRLVR